MSGADGMVDFLTGAACLIVGVEPDCEGATRVYVGHRMRGLYFVVTGEDAERCKRAWEGTARHLTIRLDAIPYPLLQDQPDMVATA